MQLCSCAHMACVSFFINPSFKRQVYKNKLKEISNVLWNSSHMDLNLVLEMLLISKLCTTCPEFVLFAFSCFIGSTVQIKKILDAKNNNKKAVL